MRKFWIDSLIKISLPILDLASKDQLKESMPVFKEKNEAQYLEAIGRIVCGIAPWISLPFDDSDESIKRRELKALTLKTLANLVNPNAKDYIDFAQNRQSLVDAAYLAQGLIRCPSLYEDLDSNTKKELLIELKKTRKFVPAETNWLLFAAMIETFLFSVNEEIIESRLIISVDKFLNRFYIGDGMYGDGIDFHFDYYNSYVIHPMLTDILESLKNSKMNHFENLLKTQHLRHQRYAVILERMISPTGTWPIIGRTLSCRIGAFHALSHAAYKSLLANDLEPEQVRCALNSVLQTFLSNPNNFDSKGFLTVGLNGSQTDIAEDYISSGSSYHAVTFFTALGIPSPNDFWSKPDKEWTALKAFSGKEVFRDHAYDESIGSKVIISKLIKILLDLVKNKLKIGKNK